MKRLLALVMLLCLAAVPAAAEEDVLITTRPLVDLTATAVMLTGEPISPDAPLSESLAECIISVGLIQELGYTSFDANNSAWRDTFLSNAYTASHSGVGGGAAVPENYAYYGVRPMAIDESDDGSAVRILGDVYQAVDQLEALDAEQYAQVKWLDQRAVAELRRHADAPGGWQLYSFSLDAEWEMEQAAQDYFADTMVEYVNTMWGFSIQYPAVFGEDAVSADENGVAGRIDQASFRAACTLNDQGWTTESFLEAKKQETPGAETNINDITGYGQLTARVDGEVLVFTLIVTQDCVYQTELRYHQSLESEFALYSEYMMNSFTVDEMGLG